jgi:hypothetical protein
MHSKRQFLTGAGLAFAAAAATMPAFAQGMKNAAASDAAENGPPNKKLANRMAKTTKLFKAPAPWPNALASSPQGLWIGQQHLTSPDAKSVDLPWPTMKGKEQVWLMDMTGKLLKTCESDAVNVSGLAFGNGSLWVMSNTTDASSGIHQVDVASGKEVAQRQIPLSPNNITGGIHGAQWHDGKLWIANNRMRSLIRMNPVNWTGELQFPIAAPLGLGRFHDFTFDKDGTILQVIANEKSKNYSENIAGLVRYDASDGKALETITFVPGSCDPHGLEYHNGVLVGCDAGFHPGWPNQSSPFSGWVFRIDLV